MKKIGNKWAKWLRRREIKLSLKQAARKLKRRNRRLQRAGKKPAREKKVIYKDHVILHLPEVFNLYANYEETVSLIIKIREFSLKKQRNVRLNFDSVKTIEPAAMLCLVAEIDRCNRLNDNKLEVTGTYPKDLVVEALLEFMGFFDLIKIRKRERHGINENEIPIKIIKFFSEVTTDGTYIHKLIKNLLENQSKIKESSSKLYDSLIEAMTNVGHHAYAEGIENSYPFLKGRWWMVGSIDLEHNMLTAIFYDQGVGIPETAPKNYEDSFIEALLKSRNDGEIIHKVITEGWTRTKAKNRGKGLRHMVELINHIGGKSNFRILSGYGDYKYIPRSSGSPEYKNNKAPIGGTLIEWKIPLNSIIMEDTGKIR